MKSSPFPEPSVSNYDQKLYILIERKTKKTDNELSISYDTKLVEIMVQNEEEKSNILKLVKNILLACNISYMVYITKKIFKFLKSLLLSNICYFLIINTFIKWLYKEMDQEESEPLWKRLILFNLPELLLIFLYHRKILNNKGKSIFFLFSYLNERISYVFNKDPKNNFLCQIDQHNYDIYLIKKDENIIKDFKNFYLNNEEYLTKDTFFDSVIAYPNANFGDFDFNNLEQYEEEMFQDIFNLINEIEEKIKEDNKIIISISSFARNLSFSISTKMYILYSLGLKVVEFIIGEIILNAYLFKSQRNKLTEEKTKKVNQKNMSKGYFLALNEDVILLFRIKDKYKSFDESYSILYDDSQKLFKHYFK